MIEIDDTYKMGVRVFHSKVRNLAHDTAYDDMAELMNTEGIEVFQITQSSAARENIGKTEAYNASRDRIDPYVLVTWTLFYKDFRKDDKK
jgi:hypothetical protein